ncbi:hypothetical protein O181_120876 [Austropuccinia psidii MF-1]|uniref:Uncharacterized protein n=1 Tax=Austropuccinia psidii MF-1 TaxID=1389203 RepID=A0A9Q3KIH3_9BASI|nr:hypothetical protein [Austropuccinia psidii MF-1]
MGRCHGVDAIEHPRGPIGHKRYDMANWPQLGSRLDCRNHQGLMVVTQSHIIPSTPRTFQPTIATLPISLTPVSLSSSTARPAFIPVVRPTLIPKSRTPPIVTCKQLQPVASSSRIREQLTPLPFPATQVLQQGEQWPI